VRTTLADLQAVARWLGDFDAPWWVAGGWALDLWAGGVSREHQDIEISILRTDQARLYAYCADWPRFVPRAQEWIPMRPGEELAFPEFQVQVRPSLAVLAAWPGLPAEFEFMLNNVDEGGWVFRPEPAIHRAWDRARLPTDSGLWVAAPEIVLLHKCRHHRPKDEHDFARALPLMNAEQRTWLRAAMTQIRPADPWLAPLGAE
jgi:hypothetical protein